MFLLEFDCFIVWPYFTVTGRMRVPLPDDWHGYAKAITCIDRELGKQVAENKDAYGWPSIGQYLEITKLKDGEPETRWWEFMLRSGVKPSIQWSFPAHHIHEVKESELLNG